MLYHNTPEWLHYERLMKERPSAFRGGSIEIIADQKMVDRYYEETGRKMGVLYESGFHLLVVDLVRQKTGEDSAGNDKPFLYERLLPAVENGAVVAVPLFREKFVLLKQFRHATRKTMLSFPRGFGEEDLSETENVQKELMEEIHAQKISIIERLGEVVPDSGILGTSAAVFLCEVDSPNVPTGYEGIESVVLMNRRELEKAILSKQITDSYTLSAYALYCSKFPER